MSDENDVRVDAARVAQFGRPDRPVTSAAAMPVSGVSVQWRTDGFYRESGPGGAEDFLEEDWTSWENVTITGGRSEVKPGDSAEPTWWLDWGFAAPEDRVSCWLADDGSIAVVRLGWLWIAERVSTAQPMFLDINGEVTELEVTRPNYQPPAAYPFTRTAANPRQPH
jgi:hypothetical protein